MQKFFFFSLSSMCFFLGEQGNFGEKTYNKAYIQTDSPILMDSGTKFFWVSAVIKISS